MLKLGSVPRAPNLSAIFYLELIFEFSKELGSALVGIQAQSIKEKQQHLHKHKKTIKLKTML
jgi:hypothetical protein